MSESIPMPDYDLGYDLYWHTKGMDADEKERMKRGELDRAEEERWEEVGITCPKVAWGWKARGVTPDDAAVWHRAGFLPDEADSFREKGESPDDLPLDLDERRQARALGLRMSRAVWFKRDGGFSVEEAAVWAQLPFKPNASRAAAWRGAGFTPLDAFKWNGARFSEPDQAKGWRDAGFLPDDAWEWHSRGIPAELAADLEEAGLAPGDPLVHPLKRHAKAWAKAGLSLKEAVPWARGKLTPETAKPWLAAGFAGDDAAAWANLDRSRGLTGYTPEGALEWIALGISAEEALAAADAGQRRPEDLAAPRKERARPKAEPPRKRAAQPSTYGQAELRTGAVGILFWGVPFPGVVDRGPWEDPQPLWEWRERFVARSEGRTLEDLGCKLDTYGQVGPREFHLPYAAVVASEVRRADVGSIDVPELQPSWEERLRAFCEVLGVECADPGWHVASLWAEG